MDKVMKNKKGVELVTILSMSYKIYLDKFIFWSVPLNLKTVEYKVEYSTSRWKEVFRGKTRRSFILISFICSLKIENLIY